MTTLVKIRGLQRGAPTIFDTTSQSGVLSTGEAGPASVRGFRVKSAIGRHYKQNTTAVTATATSGTLTWSAAYPGAYGNDIQVAIVVAGTSTPLTVAVTNQSATAKPIITLNSATDGGGAATTRAIDAANLLNSDAAAAQLVTVAVGGSLGATPYVNSSTVTAFSAKNLASGSNGTGTLDAEPGPQTGGVTGEPIFLNVTNKTTWVVDTDDQVTARTLMRNRWRFIEIGAA